MKMEDFNALLPAGPLPLACYEWDYFRRIIEAKGVDEAIAEFLRHRKACAAVASAEFQAKHSALSPEGAAAYAAHWH